MHHIIRVYCRAWWSIFSPASPIASAPRPYSENTSALDAAPTKTTSTYLTTSSSSSYPPSHVNLLLLLLLPQHITVPLRRSRFSRDFHAVRICSCWAFTEVHCPLLAQRTLTNPVHLDVPLKSPTPPHSLDSAALISLKLRDSPSLRRSPQSQTAAMASASTFQSVLRQVLGSPLTIPSIFGGIAFVAYKNQDALISFVTGPGSLTRILLLLSAVINWKALPLGWSVWLLLSRSSRLTQRLIIFLMTISF